MLSSFLKCYNLSSILMVNGVRAIDANKRNMSLKVAIL
jgi:hypothetical protein